MLGTWVILFTKLPSKQCCFESQFTIVWVPQTSLCLPCDDDDDDDDNDDDENDDDQYDKDYDDNDYDKDDDDHHHFIWWQRLYMYVSLKWKKKTTNSTSPNLYQQQREFLYAPHNQYVRCAKYDFLSLTEDKLKIKNTKYFGRAHEWRKGTHIWSSNTQDLINRD